MPRSRRSRQVRRVLRRAAGRRRPWVHRGSILLVTVGIAIGVAACGSSGRSTRGSGGHLTPAQAQQDAVRFSDCMRSHGLPNFPDPTSPHEFKFLINPSSGVNLRSPAFHSAETACRHLLPAGPPNESPARSQRQTSALLVFAHCLRSHGFPDFPDPINGQVTHEMLAQAGINLHQPAVLQAAYACVGVTHGVITRQDVARFIAGQ